MSPKLLWFHVASVSLQTYHGPERKALTTAHTNHNYNLGDLHSQDAKTESVSCNSLERKRKTERKAKDGMMRTDSGLILTCHITQVSDVVLGRVHMSARARGIPSLISSILKQHVVCVCVLFERKCVHHFIMQSLCLYDSTLTARVHAAWSYCVSLCV